MVTPVFSDEVDSVLPPPSPPTLCVGGIWYLSASLSLAMVVSPDELWQLWFFKAAMNYLGRIYMYKGESKNSSSSRMPEQSDAMMRHILPSDAAL